ncbi:MAG: diacylglycerol kinase family protein [Phycisphaerales bacterium]
MPHPLIISNAHSGRGHAGRVVGRAVEELRRSGIAPALLPVDRGNPAAFRGRFDRALRDASAVILAGGDGTVHYALPVVAGSGVPVYHLPLGTENLFSREFGSCTDPARLVRALRGGRARAVDLGGASPQAGGPPTLFALMCSVGPDAGVIRRLHAARTGAISHLSYVRPMVEELTRPSLPVLSVEVDGRALVHRERGMVVVANSRHYGARFNPAADAVVDDGLLDVVFFPAGSGPAAMLWLLRSLLGVHTSHPACVTARARSVLVTGDGPLPHQLDGELGRHETTVLDLAVRPAALRVLVAPD